MPDIPDIVVVNGHGLGEYCYVKRIPLKGETALPYNRHFEMDAGKGTNAAIVIARLGGKVAFVGKAGMDEGGKLGEKWMGESGVDLTHYILDPNVETNLGLVIIAENGENMILNFDDDKNAIAKDELERHLRQCAGAKYLVTGFEIPVETSLFAARLAKELGMFVLMNPSPIDEDVELPEMPFVDLLCVNETEAGILLKLKLQEDHDWQKMAQALREHFKCPNAVITLGKKGSAAASSAGTWAVAPTPVVMVDESGAGDGYLAALTLNLSWGKPLREAMEWASKYSAYLVTQKGSIAIYPYLDQMDGIFARLKN